jgi:poly(beta-D-mannuronate) lyase
VRLDAPDSNRNHHRIDHNYFGPRPPLGSNGGETIRIGTSHNSLEDSNTLVERNIFEECNGEVEIVSNKSGANVFRGNVFIRSQGSLTLRHGNNNVVEDNIFLGGGVENTGGVRVINAGQVVRNNLFVGLRGRNFTGALVVMNGVPNSPINRYHQVRNALIERNTFIDVTEIGFGTGADAERSLAPVDSAFRGNLIIGATTIAARSALEGVAFEGNIISGATAPAAGFAARDVQAPSIASLEALPELASLPDEVGFQAPAGIVTRAEVGPSWHQPVRAVREARRIEIGPGTDAISAALATARDGDTLALAPGRYIERAAVTIDKPIAIVAADSHAAKPSLRFEGSTFFALSGRGELALRGLHISGAAAPDAAGNSVIRLAAPHPPHNYSLTIADCEVQDLRTNRAFAVVRAEQGAFAQSVRIERSSFRDISGTALSLRGETEPLGKYSVEDLVLSDVEFANVSGPAIDVLRAGRDESTFGPRVRLERVTFNNVGAGGPAARLHGVQQLDVEHAQFERTAPIEATIEVGQPSITVNGATQAWPADVLVVRDLRS